MKKKLFSISLSLNGFNYKVFITQRCEISELLQFFNHSKELVIVEHNGKINNALEAATQYIKNKDDIEIITIVGGG